MDSKRTLRASLIAVCWVAAIGGCESPRTTTDGGGTADGGMQFDSGTDPCDGRDVCATAGIACDGDVIVECAEDAEGCLVETRTDCAASGEVCDDSGAAPVCVDACASIPEADRCETDGARACDGETLEVCAMNADGCLVLERTMCDASPGGVCDESGSMPVCLLPPDPCAGVADACTTEGTSCDADSLVTCAPDAFGCLVETRTDCSARAGGTCDASATPAACAFTGDPCAGVTECATAGTSCDGPELVSCAADAFGCMVETRTDCTATMFGFCDPVASPSATCSTAASDPCMGVTECGTESSRTCTDAATLEVCAPNAFGCYVTTTTDCAATSEICDTGSGAAMCVDPCSLVTVCPSATYCDGADLVSCAADTNGCLVEDSRSACGTGLTCDAAAGACVDAYCSVVEPVVIDCASGTVSGNTAGGSTVRTDYECETYTYPGAERIYRFQNTGTASVEVEIVATRGAGTADFDLYALDAGDGTASCTDAALSCLDSSTGTSGTETVEFVAAAGGSAYIAYDVYSAASATETTDFTLSVTCTPIVCGDGLLTGAEECDDSGTSAGDGCSTTCTIEPGYGCTGEPSVCAPLCGNGVVDTGETCDDAGTTPGDGCSATCTVEPGFMCSGTPSVCSMPAPNATCGTATAISGTTTLTAENLAAGGARPTATGCGFGTGTPTLYYSLTIPDATSVTITATPGTTALDMILMRLDSCTAAACEAVTDATFDGEPEVMTFENTSGASVTRIIAVRPYDSNVGPFDLEITYVTAACGNGAVEAGEACDDAGTTPGDGCSDTCTVESGYVCIGAPSTCSLPAPNSTCAGATAITGTTTLSEDTRLGGARPSGTACGGGTGGPTLYYSLSIPAGTTVTARVTPGAPSWDPVVMRLDGCAAAACEATADSGASGGAETMTFANTTGSSITRILAVRPYGASAGPFTLAITYITPGCGGGGLEAGEQCDDGNTTAGDGCSATCTLETPDATFTATDTPIAIPDDTPAGISSTVTATACTVAWVRPTWSITHTYAGDLVVTLVSPDGTRVTLSDLAGGSSDLSGPYTFARGAASWPPTGTPLPSGTYDAALTSFAGVAAAGTWTLEVSDNAGLDTGSLTSWSLAVGCL